MKEETSGKAIASLVFGILALVGACPCLGGILAVALGSGEEGDVARVGVILGWISLGLAAVTVLFFLLFVMVGGSLAAFG